MYTLRKIAKYFNAVAEAIINDEKLLTTKGIFRLSVGKHELPEIFEGIYNQVISNEAINGYDAHQLACSLKYMLNAQGAILNQDGKDERVNEFVELMKRNDAEDVVEDYFSFLESLTNSGDLNDLCVAEIIHTYHHLATHIDANSNINKMTASNMAVILTTMMGEKIFNLDIQTTALLLNKIHDIIEIAVKSGNFKPTFESLHSDKKIALRKAFAKDADKKFDETFKANGKIDEQIKKFTKEIEIAKRTIEKINTNYKGKPIKRKKDQIGLTLDQFEEKVSTLELKIVKLEEVKEKSLQDCMEQRRMASSMKGSIKGMRRRLSLRGQNIGEALDHSSSRHHRTLTWSMGSTDDSFGNHENSNNAPKQLRKTKALK